MATLLEIARAAIRSLPISSPVAQTRHLTVTYKDGETLTRSYNVPRRSGWADGADAAERFRLAEAIWSVRHDDSVRARRIRAAVRMRSLAALRIAVDNQPDIIV